MDPAREPGGTTAITEIAHVLTPLDGSERAEAALAWLRHLPVRRLTLLQVCEEPSSTTEAEAYLADAAARFAPPGCVVETRVACGGAAESIVAAAVDADLVVMTTRGAGGGGRLLFGSVADRVARHSPTPTLLLRGGATPASGSAPRRMVVPLDGSASAERALPVASQLASTIGTGVHLVSVEEREGPQAETPSAPPRTGYLEDRAAALQDERIAASIEYRSGPPASELLDVIVPGDLLVLTTHGRGSARRWQIGSVAEKLLRQAAAPVVLVRAEPA